MQSIRPLSRLLVTGGSGFIGSAFIRFLLRAPFFSGKIVNLDLLTYAANIDNLNGFRGHPRYKFFQGDICNQKLVEMLIEEEEIDAIVHFAAETHVDRSIASAAPFIQTNVFGTLSLLEAARKFPSLHFHHISTDEVYGSLGESGVFTEHSSYRPNSPYAASKASSDHLVRAFRQTHQVSTTISHCCNNYGPSQFPEKLIPLMISNAITGKPLPVYGNGAQVREWLFVDDHAEAIWAILQRGRNGDVYNIGGNAEYSNLEILTILLESLALEMNTDPSTYKKLIRFVTDRPGHDFRYALDSSKIEKELNWKPKTSLKDGLKKTIRWYVRSMSQVK